MTNKRRLAAYAAALTAVLCALVAGGVFAAHFTTTGDIGTNSVSASCQSATMTVDFTTALDAGTPTYQITHVALGNIDNGCRGRTVQLRLTADNGATIYAQGSGTIPNSANATIALDTPYAMPDNSWLITRVMLTVIT